MPRWMLAGQKMSMRIPRIGSSRKHNIVHAHSEYCSQRVHLINMHLASKSASIMQHLHVATVMTVNGCARGESEEILIDLHSTWVSKNSEGTWVRLRELVISSSVSIIRRDFLFRYGNRDTCDYATRKTARRWLSKFHHEENKRGATRSCLREWLLDKQKIWLTFDLSVRRAA